MGFQIKDAAGNAIDINTLDAEAAAFWGQELSKKSYACPKGRSSNWFDIIGYHIHCLPADHGWGEGKWEAVLTNMFQTQLDTAFNEYDSNVKDDLSLDLEWHLARTKSTHEWIQPFVELMRHWQAKGYTYVQIK